ncbi:MAG: hypothetical protein IPM53_02150 [Anaerolineaceae bacterium]|nr:hypothetical protein [Anaerolineaceae bacterium]
MFLVDVMAGALITPISSGNDCSFPPAQSDTNVCSVTYFDALGRRSGSKDALPFFRLGQSP